MGGRLNESEQIERGISLLCNYAWFPLFCLRDTNFLDYLGGISAFLHSNPRLPAFPGWVMGIDVDILIAVLGRRVSRELCLLSAIRG